MSTSASPHEPLALRQVYALLFEHSKSFFIGTTSSTLGQVYYDHRTGRRYTTRAAATAESSFGAPPRLYLLHTLHGTKKEGFPHLVIWAHFLQEGGYTCLNPPDFCRRAAHLTSEESDLYQDLASLLFADVFSPEKALFPKPASPKGKAPSRHTITITVSAQEHATYTARAKAQSVSLSELTRECLHLGGVFSIDLSALTDCLRSLESCQQQLHDALTRYTLSGACTPSGSAELRDISEKIQQSTSDVSREVMRLCRKLQTVVRGDKPLADLQL